MKKRIFGIMAVICLMLGLMTTAVAAEGGTVVKTVATETELLAALADSANGTVKLTADVKLNETLSITRAVTIDLNGCVLGKFYSGSGFGPGIRVENGGALTLIDSDPTVGHKFTNYGRKLWKLSEYGTNIVNGGVITGDPLYAENGVYVQKGGTFIMKGGNIAGCLDNSFGGGVFNAGSFVMEGGNILGCQTEGQGGAVYVRDGIFTMTGGNIGNCRASLDGDGIHLSGSAVMYANGGEVNENVFLETNSRITAAASLGGVTAFRQGAVNTGTIAHGSFSGDMTSTGTISGGTFDGNVTNTGTISGGTFSGNVANKLGSKVSGGSFTGTVTVEVVIDTDNGSDRVTQEIPRGETLSKPDDPQKTGHYFTGWYDGDTPFYFDGPVLDAVTIKAKWVEGIPVPRLRINAETNEWEVSYDAGYTWTSLGVKVTGEKGEKGDKGDKGDAGTDGKDGINGKDGVDGANGADGRDGKDGVDGKDGKDGIGVSSVTVDKDGNIIVTLTDGSTHIAGSLPAADDGSDSGKNSAGCAGVSLVGALSGVLLSGIGFALIKRRKPF